LRRFRVNEHFVRDVGKVSTVKIGISGASGQLGQAVLAELVQRGGGHQIVGISRSPERLQAPVEGRRGDFDAPESLATAFQGLDRLLLIPSADLRPGVRGRQMKAAIDASNQAGVKHLVLMSAAGTRQAVEPSLGEAYWTAEQHLIRTAASWTILRMNYYAEAMAQEVQMSAGMGMLTGLGEERVAYVSRNDVGAAAAGILLGDGHAGAIYNATGPAVLTGQEVASVSSEIVGKPISFAAIPSEQLRGGLTQAGLPEPVINTILDIKSTFVRGDFDVLTTDVQRLSGRKPKTFRDVLAGLLTQGAKA
jgi:NAD(P)H dehydrogenase (quinone)